MLKQKPQNQLFAGIDYNSAEQKGLAELLKLKDSENNSIFEKVTVDNYPEIFDNNRDASKILGLAEKDIYLCRDYSYCPHGEALLDKNAILLNKDLTTKLSGDEQRSLIAHERQHFEQKRDFTTVKSKLQNTVFTFLQNFSPMLPALNSVSAIALGCILHFTAKLSSLDLDSKERSRMNELDSDKASVKVAGAAATLSAAHKMLMHKMENSFEDGYVKKLLIEKFSNLKSFNLPVVETLLSGFGIKELLSNHPNPIKRGREIAALEGKQLEDIMPQASPAR